MNPPQSSTTQDSSTKPPNAKNNTPPDATSGVYRHSNQESTCLYEYMYVLCYEGCAWPAKREQYDGIIGVYHLLANAKRAGDRWLSKYAAYAALAPDGSDSTESRILDWEVNGETGDWEKKKAWSGLGFLESRVVRVKECEVMTGSSLPKKAKGSEEGDGKGEEIGKDVEGKAAEGEKSHVVDEQNDAKGKGKGEGHIVEDMKGLTL